MPMRSCGVQVKSILPVLVKRFYQANSQIRQPA